MEGDSVTLHNDVETNPDWNRWDFHNIIIADRKPFCTDVTCNKRYKDRLKLDHQTGSLTITNTRITDSGVYQQWITGSGRNVFTVVVRDVSGVDTDRVFVKEGDSVTLYTGVKTDQQDTIKWYFNKTLIAQISGYLGLVCKEVQCNIQGEGQSRNRLQFRKRLQVDSQTGSLTIRNINTTDSGLYDLLVISRLISSSTKIFNVTIPDVPAQRDEMKRKSVVEGDSVTLNPGVIYNPNDSMTCYFNDTLIAEIAGGQNKICADNECKERFRDRLKLDHQTGSLTIMNINTTDSGIYNLQITSTSFSIIRSFSVTVTGFFGVDTDGGSMSVMEGDSVTLQTGIKTNQPERIKWYFNGFQIAVITGDLSFICTDVQCEDGAGRFRDRLKLDHQTGSLTIMNIRTTDSGLYKLEINSRRGTISTKIFIVAVSGFLGVGADGLSAFVMEEDSVTLHSDVKTNQQQSIKWFIDQISIAVISELYSYICTDVQCNVGSERFRARLKLDNQTGSLTITNTRTTDSGVYQLQIINSNTSTTEFGVEVHNFSAAERDEIKRKLVKEGESVTLYTGEIKNPNYLMTWCFNDTRIAEITGNQSKICTVVQCEDGDERFRDRLKVNHSSGSLTIMNTRITDSGDYQLNITSSRITIIRNFSVSVIADLTGIYAAVSAVLLLVVASAGLIYSCKCHSRRKYIRTQHNDQVNGVEDSSPDQTDSILMTPASQIFQTETDAVNEAPT
ncbi:uncharacterized protein [Sinocyclocheilus grahami]|nr:PREDICTED: uncharacterized protein LOC107575914 isoform X2 [Sinocyclocheilus grahami]